MLVGQAMWSPLATPSMPQGQFMFRSSGSQPYAGGGTCVGVTGFLSQKGCEPLV